jgi:hypothetical protein
MVQSGLPGCAAPPTTGAPGAAARAPGAITQAAQTSASNRYRELSIFLAFPGRAVVAAPTLRSASYAMAAGISTGFG